MRARWAGLALVAALGACSESQAPRPRDVVRVRIVPQVASIELQPGQTAQLTATAYGEDDQIVRNVAIRWGTSDPDAATVSEAGLVTAVAAGYANVSASAGERREQIGVWVRE